MAVSLVPAPATSGTSTASRTARPDLLDLLVVGELGPSPVVPATTSPSLPWATSQRASVGGAVEVERAVVGERRDHRGEHPAEAGGAHQPDPSDERSMPSVASRSSCSSNQTVW